MKARLITAGAGDGVARYVEVGTTPARLVELVAVVDNGTTCTVAEVRMTASDARLLAQMLEAAAADTCQYLGAVERLEP